MLTGFENTSTLRFGTMDLVRSDWRKYPKTLAPYSNKELEPVADEGAAADSEIEKLEVGSVNIEENALNQPPYVLPPGIDRQVLSGNAGAQKDRMKLHCI